MFIIASLISPLDIGPLLVQARIAQGVTQRDLANA